MMHFRDPSRKGTFRVGRKPDSAAPCGRREGPRKQRHETANGLGRVVEGCMPFPGSIRDLRKVHISMLPAPHAWLSTTLKRIARKARTSTFPRLSPGPRPESAIHGRAGDAASGPEGGAGGEQRTVRGDRGNPVPCRDGPRCGEAISTRRSTPMPRRLPINVSKKSATPGLPFPGHFRFSLQRLSITRPFGTDSCSSRRGPRSASSNDHFRRLSGMLHWSPDDLCLRR